jgi:hypothetical protein
VDGDVIDLHLRTPAPVIFTEVFVLEDAVNVNDLFLLKAHRQLERLRARDADSEILLFFTGH